MPAAVASVHDTIGDRIEDIAHRLSRLTPDWSNPQRFYTKRDDLVDELVGMARGRQ